MLRRICKSFVPLALVLAVAMPALAGPLTEETARELTEEVRQLRETLEEVLRRSAQRAGPPAPVRVTVAVDRGHALGSKDAPITIVEFSDYQCPFCKRFFDTAYQDIKKNYIDTGKVRFISRNLPLPFHPHAEKAAQAVHCAGDQNKYWEMREAVFNNSGALQEEKLVEYAKALKVDAGRFESCLSGESHLDEIRGDVEEAQKLGINGTPSFVLGRSAKDRMEGEVINGALPYAVFEARIKELLPAEKDK